MDRVLVLVGLVGLLMATGVAAASPANQVRLPVNVEQAPGTDHPESVMVEKGDHLWKISARHLGDEVSNDEIAPYWRTVIEVNTPTLRSGNPDLIYPGEVVELPGKR